MLSFTLLFLVKCNLIGNTYGYSYFCETNISQPWCIPETYDPNIDPITFHDQTLYSLPWKYTFDYWVHEVTSVDDKRNLITFSMYFRTEWYDPRIQINLNSSIWRDGIGKIKNEINIPLSTPIWFPDLEVDFKRFFLTQFCFTFLLR